MTNFFNPLDKRNLGKSVADALLETNPVPLDLVGRFTGAGIYAIYYCGSFPAYGHISSNPPPDIGAVPIYVGKAVPAGARKGLVGLDAKPGNALSNRLREHSESIRLADNIDLSDFHCRYLLVDDIWIPLGESLLIARFAPVWNHIVDGFGNHDPGKGRYAQERSRWDVVHSGRAWAEKCAKRLESSAIIIQEVENYLNSIVGG